MLTTALLTASPWIVRFLPLIPHGRGEDAAVLDLACGNGRHSRLLLAHNYQVVALDRDLAGVTDLNDQPGAALVAADLEDGSPWPLGERRFAGIVVTNYLHRRLFGQLAAALAPNGVLLYETFARGNERYGKPSNPDFLLAPGELLATYAARLHIVAYEHGRLGGNKPRLVQRICAINLAPGEPGDLALQQTTE